MQKLLVCQHVPFEILGTLNPLLREAGFRMRYVNFGRHPDARPGLDGYSGLVILGGPMSAYEVEHGHLATEVSLIRDGPRQESSGVGHLSRRPAHRESPSVISLPGVRS